MSEDWKNRALAAEGMLGFVLLSLGKDVFVTKELIEDGFPKHSGINVEDLGDKVRIGMYVDPRIQDEQVAID